MKTCECVCVEQNLIFQKKHKKFFNKDKKALKMSSKKFDTKKKLLTQASTCKTTPRSLKQNGTRTLLGTPTTTTKRITKATATPTTTTTTTKDKQPPPERERTFSLDIAANPLNIAFSKAITTPLVSSKFSSALSSAAPKTPKTMSTAFNACYTPSSLYRSAQSSPSKFRSGASSSAATPRSVQRGNAVISSSCADDTAANTEISNMTVAVRVRPLNAHECCRPSVSNIVQVNGKELTVQAGTTADNSAGVTHTFLYDYVFNSCNPESRHYANQQTVFEETALPLIDRAFEGYNACLFAYGQTGSGKSYSMMGIDALDDAVGNSGEQCSEAGIIPRFCHELFRRIEMYQDSLQVEVEVSYFEIYNEKIHDLLCVSQVEALCNGGGGGGGSNGADTPSQRVGLKVREHPIWGPYIVDLSMHSVNSYETLRNWLAVGNSQRATAATGMNDKSSRSHSIFNIILNISEATPPGSADASDSDNSSSELLMRQTRRSKISLVDLAGSERISGSNGERMREGVSINKSLLTLGKVIAALSNAKKNCKSFVPYRESVLTWLLRENLGGNSKTVMLATISPASLHLEETLSTLRYACQARSIVNRVKVNESPHDRIIRELRAEVDRLKSLRQDYERNKRLSASSSLQPRKIIFETAVDESEVEALRQQLAESEKELQRAEKTWMERLKEAEDQRKSENYLLKQRGLALELSNQSKQACLINLAADPILSGTLFYVLPPGVIKIGRARISSNATQPQILLEGDLVAPLHCSIEHQSAQLFIKPETESFETHLNGELLTERRRLFHGDRLIIGKTHYFRISNPFCPQHQLQQSQLVDYQLAHSEILQKQEAKLRQQLDEEKRKAFSQIQKERLENERNYKEKMDLLDLEQFKFKCSKELLETERKALEQRVTTENSEATLHSSSYKSTLLEDIKRIMQQPSEESQQQVKLLTQEAMQLCARLGLQLEFRPLQVKDEFGMCRLAILIVDRLNNRKAEWPTARLGVWLEQMRECTAVVQNAANIENIFDSVEIDWQPMETQLFSTANNGENGRKSSSKSVLRSSNVCSPKASESKHRKLLNTPTNVKKLLTFDQSPLTPISDRIASPSSGVDLHSWETKENFTEAAALHVRNMQKSAKYLKKLYAERNRSANLEAQRSMKNSIESLEAILNDMRHCLNENSNGLNMEQASNKNNY